jgi:hypothetical protein
MFAVLVKWRWDIGEGQPTEKWKSLDSREQGQKKSSVPYQLRCEKDEKDSAINETYGTEDHDERALVWRDKQLMRYGSEWQRRFNTKVGASISVAREKLSTKGSIN